MRLILLFFFAFSFAFATAHADQPGDWDDDYDQDQSQQEQDDDFYFPDDDWDGDVYIHNETNIDIDIYNNVPMYSHSAPAVLPMPVSGYCYAYKGPYGWVVFVENGYYDIPVARGVPVQFIHARWWLIQNGTCWNYNF